MSWVVVVVTAGQAPRVAGPYRAEGRAEGARSSIEALDLEDTTATVVPCLPVEAWTPGRAPSTGLSPAVD